MMVNVDFINPFVGAACQALEIMARSRPTGGDPFVKTGHVAKGDIRAVIGLAGEAVGMRWP